MAESSRLRARETSIPVPSLPWLCTGFAFILLFWGPALDLARDWWHDPDAGHGLLLAPLAVYLAWQSGRVDAPRPQPWLGIGLTAGATLLRYASSLAAEVFTTRLSVLAALAGLIVFAAGARQLFHWWLPGLLLLLSIPLPAVVLGSITLSLQLHASEMGARLLEWRDVPVHLAGNVIHLPGHSLFVAEACSGLRSLTALLSLSVLIGGLWLRAPWARTALFASAIPIAVLLNGLRVFLIGFLVFYVDPRLGSGVLHYGEGWLLFMVALGILAGGAALLGRVESRWSASV